MEINQLPNFVLRSRGVISDAFIEYGSTDFHQAVETVQGLPYGRTSNKTDQLLVLDEGQGTCSTKHALLYRLATEQGASAFQLTLGIYEMDERNTPGVGQILSEHGIESIPEAHCYLTVRGQRFDGTKPSARVPVDDLLYEEAIQPSQIGAYKAGLHRRFLTAQIEQEHPERSAEELWAIREDCITALEQ